MERDDHQGAFYEFSKRRQVRKKIDLLLRLYSAMGLVLAVSAAGYFLFTLLPFALSSRQQMAIMLSGVGLALAVMSRTLIAIRKEKESEEVDRLRENKRLYLLLDSWNRFERVSKELLAEKGEDFSRHSLRSLISKLYEDRKIDADDVRALEEALQTRNLIVHGNREVSGDDVEKVINFLVAINHKITPSK